MKNFAMIGVAALLTCGFYALGSTSSHYYTKTNQLKVCSVSVTDTVPKKDTTNKRMPRDTTSRKDSLNQKD